MLEALKEAKKSYNKGDVPVGAIIVYNNKIIARAHNLKEKSKNATKHAEILAINIACKKLKWVECSLILRPSITKCLRLPADSLIRLMEELLIHWIEIIY